MRAVTFDIESISRSAMRGRVDVTDQELTVVAIHDSDSESFSSYTKDELSSLWPIIEHADLLIGFNSNTFDIPLLNRYYPGDLTTFPSLDLLVEVQKVLGRRVRLDSLAQATLGRGKTGDGLKAGDWWRQGDVNKVRAYCIEDVRLTRELYDYALTHGILKFKDLQTIRDIKLDTTSWLRGSRSAPALTHALPL